MGQSVRMLSENGRMAVTITAKTAQNPGRRPWRTQKEGLLWTENAEGFSSQDASTASCPLTPYECLRKIDENDPDLFSGSARTA
ncbi:MAG: hypothetical protein VB101_08615 [Rhodospirillaceae bacterium]|nr:hypothetical protein [Rhodospirillaceae bacterium]